MFQTTRFTRGLISQKSFLDAQEQRQHGQELEYGTRQPQVNRALMEAWAWLEREVFLTRDANQPGRWFWVTRRGQRVTSREEFEAYRKRSLLPKGQLHPLIAGKVYPAFLRGEYDTAVFQAFREIEVGVRAAGKLPDDLVVSGR